MKLYIVTGENNGMSGASMCFVLADSIESAGAYFDKKYNSRYSQIVVAFDREIDISTQKSLEGVE